VRRDALLLLSICLAFGACRRATAQRVDPGSRASAAAASTPAPSAAVPSAAVPQPLASAPPAEAVVHCREQRVQDFLLRKGQLAQPDAGAATRARIAAARALSERYRTEHYGFFPGFGSREQNPHSPKYYAKTVTFFGLEVVVHEKIVPALRCVEQAVATDCAAHPYRPRRITGLREHNTYRDYEVSNHVYGIAIDIDSDLNPCCGCVPPWNQNPVCQKPVRSPFERMAMPACWVRAFERFGFYWLGHDELEDTMHFEFLGDPEHILG